MIQPKPLLVALSLIFTSLAFAGDPKGEFRYLDDTNPFEMNTLDHGYQIATAEKKDTEGKCGEGRCGAATQKDSKKTPRGR